MGNSRNTDQHPPLPVPPRWGRDERMLVIKLERLLDELYKKVGDIDRRLKKIEEE